MTERRFTDREVARILERATELDRRSPDGAPGSTELAPPRGLTVTQLQEIGREVGIAPDLIARAAAEVHRPAGLRPGALLGAPPVSREVRSVPAALAREEMAALVRVLDERVPAQGTATEALGTVRWSSDGRLLDRQVSLEPGAGETLIRVEERYETRVPALLQGIPAAYGVMIGLIATTEWLGGGAMAGLLGAVFLGAVALALGRLVWSAVAGRSRARAYALAEELAEVASGMLAAGGDAPTGDDGAG